jgi:type III pantothenate kinase
MNFVADIGNTTIKVAIFNNQNIVCKERFLSSEALASSSLLKQYNCKKAIISSVREIPAELVSLIKTNIPYLHILSGQSALPFEIGYKTPETLGMDRVAAVAGAYNKYTSDNVLVIDAGTAITYDLLNERIYAGGSISPGLEMRFRALNSFTGKLPLVRLDEEEALFPATDTINAIKSGVVNGIVFEINEYIRKFEKNYSDPVTVITGGDSAFLNKHIEPDHHTEPDLVLHGLNYILEYNA